MTDYGSKIADLEKRAADLGAKLTRLADRRGQYAFDATEGDKAAIGAISDIDTQVETLRREQEILTAAIERARHLQREQEADVARRDRQHREAEARKTADAVVAINNELDRAMTALRQRFERRAELIGALGRTGVFPSTFTLRLLQKIGPTSAARAAGLNDYLSLEPVPVHLVKSLAESNGSLRGAMFAQQEDAA